MRGDSFEHQTQGERLDAIMKEAAVKLGCQVSDLRWQSWIHSFGTTAGPRKGTIAGQAFTQFQVYGFEFNAPDGLMTTKYCAGQWAPWDGKLKGWD